MKAREEMPLLRCALGPTGRPFGDGLHSVTASGTDSRKAVITRNWDMAGSTLKKPIRGRKMGVGACRLIVIYVDSEMNGSKILPMTILANNQPVQANESFGPAWITRSISLVKMFKGIKNTSDSWIYRLTLWFSHYSHY